MDLYYRYLFTHRYQETTLSQTTVQAEQHVCTICSHDSTVSAQSTTVTKASGILELYKVFSKWTSVGVANPGI